MLLLFFGRNSPSEINVKALIDKPISKSMRKTAAASQHACLFDAFLSAPTSKRKKFRTLLQHEIFDCGAH